MYSFDIDQLPPPDGDGDGVDNNADCAWTDPGAFALPDDVPLLTVDRGPLGESLLEWSDLGLQAGSATVYDVAKGDVASLSVSGTGAAVQLDCAVALTSATDPAVLLPGESAYYVVRGSNVCGDGPWGGAFSRNP